MKELTRQLDEPSRRDFCAHAAKAFLGVTLLPVFGDALPVFAKPGGRKDRGTAKNVIYLYMAGGMSHLDTFDTKPDTDVQGPVETIKTNADGVQVSQYLPQMAKHMDKVAVIRSMNSTQGAHEQGRYLLHTSYPALGTIQHPSLGAWTLKLSGRKNERLPGYVVVGNVGRSSGQGFFEASYAPVVIGNPNQGLQNSTLPKGVSQDVFDRRLKLAEKFDRQFHRSYKQKKVRAYTDMYQDAITLMKSEDLKVFDLGQERESVRGGYGQNSFGQGCLLARRLVERDVRFVEVTLGGWDTHSDNFEGTQRQAAVLDQALSALLADLTAKGLLDSTLVVVATEFGRTPKINENEGRDHHNKAFSCLLAGGGIKGGQAYGKTDARGAAVEADQVSIPDFNATIAQAIGLSIDEELESPGGRPFTVAHKGEAIESLLGVGPINEVSKDGIKSFTL